MVRRLKARARRNGRSLEAELRLILDREAERPPATGEEAGAYEEGVHELLERIAARSSAISVPKEPGRFKDLRPIKVPGKPASQMVIEDRD